MTTVANTAATPAPLGFFYGRQMADNPNAQVTVDRLLADFEFRDLQSKNSRQAADVAAWRAAEAWGATQWDQRVGFNAWGRNHWERSIPSEGFPNLLTLEHRH